MKKRVLLISVLIVAGIFALLYWSGYIFKQKLAPEKDSSIQISASHYERGIQFYKKENYKRALEEFRKAIESNPQFERAYRKIVDVCKEKNDLPYATKYFEDLAAKELNNPFPYYGLGLAHNEDSNFSEAIDNFEKAVLLQPRLPKAYPALVHSYKQLNELARGLQFMKALIDSTPQNAFAWLGLGLIYRFQWNLDKALESIDTALTLNPHLLEAYTVKINIFFATGRLAEGLDLSLTGLGLAKEQRDKEYESSFLGNVGSAHLYIGNFHEGLDYSKRASELSRELGDKQNQAKWLGNVGVAHRYLGEFTEALNSLTQALEIDRQLKNRSSEEYDLGNMGDVYIELGEYRKALEYHTKALAITREVGNKRNEAIDLGNIGAIYSYMGDYPNSLKYRELALKIDRELGLKGDEGIDLGNVGLTHYDLGNYTKALEYLVQALKIAQEIEDKGSIAHWMLAMASCYYTLGILPKALEYNKKATEIVKEIGDKVQEARCLGTDGVFYTELKDYPRSLECFDKALEIFVENGAKREEAIALGNIATVCTETGDFLKALGYQEKALAINKEIGNMFNEGETYNGLGALYLKSKQYQSSIQSFKKALKIGKEISVPKIIWEAHAGLGTGYEEAGNYSEAMTHYKASVEAIENIRGGLLSEEQKLSFLENKIETYKKVQGLLFKLYQEDQTKGFAEEAFEYAERAKARSLLDLLVESKIDIHQGGDTGLINQEKDLFRKITEIQAELKAKHLTEDDADKLRGPLEKEERLLDQLRVKLRNSSPAYANLKYPEPVSLGEAQKTILGEKDLVLEYSLGEKHSYLWAITKTDYGIYQLSSKDEIAEKMEKYLHLISKPPSPETSDHALGRELYDMLVRPAQKYLESGSNVIVVPDGILYYLPFETLIYNSEQGGSRYFIESNKVSYVPSLSLLGILKTQKREGTPSRRSELLAFGNPDFGEESKSPASAELAERGLYGECGFKFVSLPYSEEEVRNIASFFPKELTSVFVRERAKEEVVKNEDLTKYKRVHFATHAVLDEKFPSRSCIVLTLDEDPSEDGYLQLNEIFNLKLDADLVVLSACETGRGKLVEGEGLIGLSRGFFYAGANSILLSLWSVNDRSTAQLMENFYRYLHEGKEKSEALRQAKIDFLKGELPSLRHPYYWAPFILLGRY